MKIFFYSYKSFESPYLEAANTQNLKTGCTAESLSLQTAGKSLGFDVVSVFTGDDVSAPVIDKLKENGVNFIAIRAAGYDNVDIPEVKRLGMKVANVPAYSPNSVAEHTIGLMLALDRKLILSDKQVHRQDFTLDNLVGFDLYKKTVGIIGTGKIGSIVARILNGIGCRILAYDIKPDESLEIKYNVHYVGLDLLCSSSDIITLHAPLNEDTRYLINKDLLCQMKEGVMLINTSRGALINTTELIEYIEKGHVGYFGMDVYEKERGLFFYDHTNDRLQDEMFKKLSAMPNVLITPHQAFATIEALGNIAATTYYNIDCWASDRDCPNELPQTIAEPQVYEEEEEL